MRLETRRFSFELPDNLCDIVGVTERRNAVTFRLLWEEERSGVIAVVKALKRKPSANAGEYEFIGRLTDPEGQSLGLYSFYGEEGACGEENADLYFRLCDRMYNVYKSIRPAPGFLWEPEPGAE